MHRSRQARIAGILVAACAVAGSLAAQPAVSRGQLLYTTHCIECHNSQMHWRDRKLATDWPSLKAQVRHWQALAFLNWSEADIVEVARHLNDTIYGYPVTSNQVGQALSR
jgi:mono/diheme cytochrome c family protein